MKHIFKWDILPQGLRKIADDLEDSPVISITIEPGVELVIRRLDKTSKKRFLVNEKSEKT